MGIRAYDMSADTAGAPRTVWSERERRSRESRMDFETAISLRCHVGKDFSAAGSWATLVNRLSDKGFALEFHGKRLCLVHQQTGVDLCTCRFLGFGFPGLFKRLGRPRVDAGNCRISPRSPTAG